MEDKVQKIKEWISNEQDGLMDAKGNFEYPEHEGAYHILCNLDAYIDSLQEEPCNSCQGFNDKDKCDELVFTHNCPIVKNPVSIWHDASKETPTQGSNILMIRKEEGSDFPPIAGCFHGTNLRLDGRNWGYYNGFCYNEIEPPVKWAYIDDILNLSNVQRTVKNWKKPVSKDLGDYINELSKQFPEVSFAKLSRIAVRVAEWKEKEMQSTIELAEDHAMLAGIIKGTEHTIGKVRSILNKVAYENNGLDVNGDYCEQPYIELDNEFKKLLKEA